MEAENDALQMSTDFSENWVNEYIGNVDMLMGSYVEDVDKLFD
jgi:hypothetical protein